MPRLVHGRVVGACKLPSEHALLHAPKLHWFLKSDAPPSTPASIDWSGPAMSVITDIEGNDQYGDCVMAEDAHYLAILTGNANALYAYSRAQTLADYAALTGFNPSNPNSDQGTDPIADLNWRVQKGYADGSKDAGWMLVDASSQALVRLALSEFGNLKLWFGIPDAIIQSMSSLGPGFVWDVTAGSPNSASGHCIGAAGYNPKQIQAVDVTEQGVIVTTWGMMGLITWAALAAWMVPSQGGGAAVRVNMDWVNKASGNAPSGVNAAALITAFNLYFGGNLPVPPSPSPSPSPTPTTTATLAQAEQWAAAGINRGHLLLTRSQAIAAANAGLAAGFGQP